MKRLWQRQERCNNWGWIWDCRTLCLIQRPGRTQIYKISKLTLAEMRMSPKPCSLPPSGAEKALGALSVIIGLDHSPSCPAHIKDFSYSMSCLHFQLHPLLPRYTYVHIHTHQSPHCQVDFCLCASCAPCLRHALYWRTYSSRPSFNVMSSAKSPLSLPLQLQLLASSSIFLLYSPTGSWIL